MLDKREESVEFHNFQSPQQTISFNTASDALDNEVVPLFCQVGAGIDKKIVVLFVIKPPYMNENELTTGRQHSFRLCPGISPHAGAVYGIGMNFDLFSVDVEMFSQIDSAIGARHSGSLCRLACSLKKEPL